MNLNDLSDRPSIRWHIHKNTAKLYTVGPVFSGPSGQEYNPELDDDMGPVPPRREAITGIEDALKKSANYPSAFGYSVVSFWMVAKDFAAGDGSAWVPPAAPCPPAPIHRYSAANWAWEICLRSRLEPDVSGGPNLGRLARHRK